MRIQPLTIEEHEKVSAEIQELKRAIRLILDLVDERIPAALMDKVIALDQKHLNRLRSRFENEMFKRRRAEPGCDIHVYYPPRPLPRSAAVSEPEGVSA